MVEMDDNATLAVLVEQVTSLNKQIEKDREERQREYAELREELRRGHENMVPRGEWGQRNTYVDSKFDSQGREIGRIREEMASKRIPITAWIAVILSALAFFWTLLGPSITSSSAQEEPPEAHADYLV